MHSNIVNAMC